MSRGITQDEEAFCQRWLCKAEFYGTETLEDVFDRFFTMFVLFNYLNNLANNLKNLGLSGDKIKATKVPVQLLGAERLLSGSGISEQASRVAELISSGVFYLRDTLVDDKIVRDLNSPLPQEKAEAVLHMIYLIRCNLFHGEKSFSDKQRAILIPCTEILDTLTKMMLESIKSESGKRD